MSRFPRICLGIAAIALTLGGACGSDDAGSGDGGAGSAGGGGAGGAAAATVAIKDDFFEPEEVEIAPGEAVTWTWEGNNPHNVSGDDFKSKIQTEGTFEHTFDEAGTFDYICTVHPSMKASVVVTEQ